MEYCPDNYIIKNCELSGYPDGREPEMPRCPVCGEQCNDFYKNTQDQEIVGCENCMKIVNSFFFGGMIFGCQTH